MDKGGLLSSDNIVWLVAIAIVVAIVVVLLVQNHRAAEDPNDDVKPVDLTYVWWIVGIIAGALLLLWLFGSKTLGVDSNPELPLVGNRGSGNTERATGSLRSPPRQSTASSRSFTNGGRRTSLSSVGSLSPPDL